MIPEQRKWKLKGISPNFQYPDISHFEQFPPDAKKKSSVFIFFEGASALLITVINYNFLSCCLITGSKQDKCSDFRGHENKTEQLKCINAIL